MNPVLRRALPLALLLHLLVAGVVLVCVKYWPAGVVRVVVDGVALEVTEAAPADGTVAAGPPVLEQALAEVSGEARALAVAAVPEVPAGVMPEDLLMARPEPQAVQVAIRPDAGLLLPGVEQVVVAPGSSNGAGVVLGASSEPGRPVAAGAGAERQGRPVALSEIKPLYPYGSRTRGESGWVTVRVKINDKGQVEAAAVVKGSGFASLDASAVAAVRQARFKPAEQEGRPVGAEMSLQFEFRLE